MAERRARWTPSLERGLINILFQLYSDERYRGPNGWMPRGWNKITETFNKKFPYAKFSRGQIQEHEAQMKREYKLIKGLRDRNDIEWDETKCMIVASDEVWRSLIAENHKTRKWQNKSFLNYDVLASLYEGVQEGQREFMFNEHEDMELGGTDDEENNGESSNQQGTPLHFGIDTTNGNISDPPLTQEQARLQSNPHRQLHQTNSPVGRTIQSPIVATARKPQVSWDKITDAVDSYLSFRAGGSVQNYWKCTKCNDEFSISQCIRVLNDMEELSKEEKALAANFFIEPYNREIFLSLKYDVRSIWIKLQIGK